MRERASPSQVRDVRREKASPAANEGVVAVDGPIEASPFFFSKKKT
jgi:hypothetical protein